MKKIYFFKSEREKTEVRSARLSAEYKYANNRVNDLRDADYMIVLGGDGTMLEAERQRALVQDTDAKIVGLAYGTANNLMNRRGNIWSVIANAQTVILHPFIVQCSLHDGQKRHQIAFNETVIHRSSPFNQTCHLDVKISNKRHDIRGHINGDGFIVASRQGYPAYYRHAGGKFLDILSDNIGTQPICDMDAKSLSCVVPNTSKVVINVQDAIKRPVIVNTDNNMAIPNVVQCKIKMKRDINVPVLMGKQIPIMRLNQIMRQKLRDRC
jgi:NAD kinase